jgi:hypothetical protein
LIVRDVTMLTAKLNAAGVPIVTTGGEPVPAEHLPPVRGARIMSTGERGL